MRRGANLSTQVPGHEVEAVADSEHRHTELEHHRIHLQRAFLKNTRRSARKNDGDRTKLTNSRCREVSTPDDRLDAELPESPRYQLRILRPEIENEDDLVLHEISVAVGHRWY